MKTNKILALALALTGLASLAFASSSGSGQYNGTAQQQNSSQYSEAINRNLPSLPQDFKNILSVVGTTTPTPASDVVKYDNCLIENQACTCNNISKPGTCRPGNHYNNNGLYCQCVN